jgi:hypothetical protein
MSIHSLLALGVQTPSVGAVDVLPEGDLACRRRECDDAKVVRGTVANDSAKRQMLVVVQAEVEGEGDDLRVAVRSAVVPY